MPIDHDQILHNASPAFHDVMQRTREVGLHKVAARLHAVPQFTFKTAAQVLGTQLIQSHLRFNKVATGIRALQALDQAGDITIQKVARAGALSKAMLEAGSGGNLITPELLQAARGGGSQAARGGGEAAKELAEAVALSGKKIPPPIPPHAKPGAASADTMEALQGLREMPPQMPPPQRLPPEMLPPEMIGGMSAGPGAAMGGGGGSPMSSASQHSQRLAHVLSTLDFTKMSNIFRLGAKGIENMAPAAAQGASKGTARAFQDIMHSSQAPAAAESMFARFAPKAMDPAVAKQTLRGAELPLQFPPMGHLPSGV